MAKRKKGKKGMRIGQTIKTRRKIRGKMREVFVTKKGKGRYTVRLVNPKKSKAGHYNYGRGYKKDKKTYNKNEYWEKKYKKKKGR